MKIAIVIKNFSLASGGGERYSVELARGLSALGHAVTVFCADADFELSADRIMSFVMVPAARRPSSLRQWRFSRAFQKLLPEYSFDVVYALTECLGADALRLGGGFSRVWVREKRQGAAGYLFERLRLRNMLKARLEDSICAPGACRTLVFNSRLCLSQACGLYSFFPGRGRVIYNGAAAHFAARATRDRGLAFRRRFDIEPEALVFLFMSNNFARKGLDTLLGAFARARSAFPKAVLLVAGGDRRGRLRFERRARGLGLAGSVVFAGRVSDAPACFAAADVFVLPTRYDPFSNVCLEAMVCGLPTVTSPMNGAAELVESGRNGFVCSGEAEIADALRALADPGVRERFSCAARSAAIRHTLEANIRATAAMLKEIANAKKDEVCVNIDDREGNARIMIRRALGRVKPFSDMKRAADFAALHFGSTVKENRKRKVVRAEIEGRVFYIKEHYPPTAAEILKMLFKFEAPFCQARREWDNLALMAELGIPSARASLCAWQKGFNRGSFIWMDDIGENVRLEDLFARGRATSPAFRRAALGRVAAIARTLHGSGYVHKDLYLGHFFVLKSDLDAGARDPKVFLLDVQRVKNVGRWNRRWMVKDLAALYFSARRTEFARREMLRFFVLYMGRGRASSKSGRAVIAALSDKADRIARHTEKLLARRAAAAQEGHGT